MRLLIYIVLAVGIGITVLTIVVGSNTFEGIVTTNPYDKGLVWDSVINKQINPDYEIVLLTDNLTVGSNIIEAKVLDKVTHKPQKLKLQLDIARPDTARYDAQHEMQFKNDKFFARVELPLQGHWNITLTATGDKGKAILHKKLYVPKPS